MAIVPPLATVVTPCERGLSRTLRGGNLCGYWQATFVGTATPEGVRLPHPTMFPSSGAAPTTSMPSLPGAALIVLAVMTLDAPHPSRIEWMRIPSLEAASIVLASTIQALPLRFTADSTSSPPVNVSELPRISPLGVGRARRVDRKSQG